MNCTMGYNLLTINDYSSCLQLHLEFAICRCFYFTGYNCVLIIVLFIYYTKQILMFDTAIMTSAASNILHSVP